MKHFLGILLEYLGFSVSGMLGVQWGYRICRGTDGITVGVQAM